MRRRFASIAVLLAVMSAGQANAAPPDLNGYQADDFKSYGGYYNYPKTAGIQFATPGGYRCRITFTDRADAQEAWCWGKLPGTQFNRVWTFVEGSEFRSQYNNVTLADMDKYQPHPSGNEPMPAEQTISPDSYQLLPAGHKLTYPQSATCAVTQTTTTCLANEHGFILDPAGSRTF